MHEVTIDYYIAIYSISIELSIVQGFNVLAAVGACRILVNFDGGFLPQFFFRHKY